MENELKQPAPGAPNYPPLSEAEQKRVIKFKELLNYNGAPNLHKNLLDLYFEFAELVTKRDIHGEFPVWDETTAHLHYLRCVIDLFAPATD